MIYLKAMITMPFRIFVQIYKMQRLLFVIISSFFSGSVGVRWSSTTFMRLSWLLALSRVMKVFSERICLQSSSKGCVRFSGLLALLLIITSFLIVSCNRQGSDDRLSERKMTELMTEVHLIDGYLSSLNKDSAVKVLPVMYEDVFKKYGLDSATFAENLKHYMGNPDLIEKIYGNVKKKLEGYNREIQTKDSLKNAYMQDSINRVYRLQKNADDMKNLISNVVLDTTDMTFAESTRMFYDYFGLAIQVYGVHISPVVEVPQVPSTDTIPPVTIDQSVEQSPVEKLPVEMHPETLRPWTDTGKNVLRSVPNTLRPLQRPKLL